MPHTIGRYGAWKVSALSDESNADDDEGARTTDYVLRVAQVASRPDGDGYDELAVVWKSGSTSISISAKFDDCAEGNLEQFYSVPVDRWKKEGRAIEGRIESDFKAWLGQATFACQRHERAAAFDLTQLRPALRAFTGALKNSTYDSWYPR